MKIVKKVVILATTLSLMLSFSGYASEISWETVPGTHNESALLAEDKTVAEDTYQTVARGDFLSAGSLEIMNNQNGTIGINIDTYAHHVVDRIFHTVFVDQWDADAGDWTQIGSWNFSATREDVEDLHVLNTSFTLTGYETNKYYRARGLHGVEYNDEIEACATETDGVLITNGPT